MARKPRTKNGSDDNVVKIPSNIPAAIRSWMERVKAEQLNHRRYMVKWEMASDEPGKGSYYIERSVLSIGKDGKVRFVGEDIHQPSPEEMEAIEAAVSKMEVPQSVHATLAQVEALRRERGIEPENFFLLPSTKKRNAIVMVQVRQEFKTGDKSYLPWTLFSDGKWRCMEPDGALPFWKPLERRALNKVMIHEGSKAARYVDWLVNDDSDEAREAREQHPWFAVFKNYEHWGITGGAMAPHRAAFDELHEVHYTEVVYCCDRDHPGESALSVVSRCYREPLVGIKFGEEFPHSWDCADRLPECFYKEEMYSGPRLEDMMIDATWATDEIPSKRGGRPTYKLRKSFIEGWRHSIKPECYIGVRNDRIKVHFGKEEFNNAVKPFSDLKIDIHSHLQSDGAGKCDTITYDPTKKNGYYWLREKVRTSAYNVFMPSSLVAKKGDPAPFYRYMKQTFPIEAERRLLLRWAATLSERPDIRMRFGILLLSERQGVGKTTFGRMMEHLVGHHNTSRPSERDIVVNQFNEFAANVRLAVIDEIYMGHSWSAYNMMKGYITDDYVMINLKQVRQYTQRNWMHVIASSNSINALKIPKTDRRWFIPKVTDVEVPESFWETFFHWLECENGYSIIKWELQRLLESEKPIGTGEHAPDSMTKEKVILESRSPEEAMAADILDRLKEGGSWENDVFFITDWAICDYISRENQRLTPRAAALRRIAADMKWHVSDDRRFVQVNYPKCYVISNKVDATVVPLAQLRDRYGKVPIKTFLKHADFPWTQQQGQ